MRNEQGKVHRPDPALASEANEARVHVEVKVKAKERNRADERAQHRGAVPADFSVANEGKADEQKESANRVQRGVNCRKR